MIHDRRKKKTKKTERKKPSTFVQAKPASLKAPTANALRPLISGQSIITRKMVVKSSHPHIYTHTQTHTDTHIHTHTHTHTQNTHTQNTHTNTYLHTYIHTYIHIYIY